MIEHLTSWVQTPAGPDFFWMCLLFLYTVYVNKMSPYSNSNYLSSTVSIV